MISVTQWFRDGGEKTIDDNLRYKKAAIDQMVQFRDRIAIMFAPRHTKDEYDKDVHDARTHFCKIAEWHTSKSVRLPVYQFSTQRITVTARDNFYNWNVSVSSVDAILLPEYFKIDSGADYLFFEGMEDCRYGKYADDHRLFSFCVGDLYALYAIMWCIRAQMREV
jgi:hypothetical protein